MASQRSLPTRVGELDVARRHHVLVLEGPDVARRELLPGHDRERMQRALVARWPFKNSMRKVRTA